MAIALNMMDAEEKAGDKIDDARIEEELGVPLL